MSSLNAMEILAAVETKYKIQVDEAKAFNAITAKDLYELVKSYLKT
jgi:acyl carrier protein